MFCIKNLGISWIVLLAIMVLPAVADDPLPAGYERMISSKANYETKLFYGNNWTQSYSGVSFNYGFTKGCRVVDLEIVGYNHEPTTKKEKPDKWDHRISAVEVPNEGLLSCDNWLMAYGQNEEGMTAVLNPGFDPYSEKKLPAYRPTDIELYYRKSPFSGKWEATYAFVAVENAGKHYADWEFVPPMPWLILSVVLDDMQDFGWRPYDVEFATDDKGEIWGTALLTNDATSGGPPVPCMRQWFEPFQLANLREQGWQLLDMELNPLIFPGTFQEKSNWPAYYGIFVNTDFVSDESTKASVSGPKTTDWIDAAGVFAAGESRLIDIEFAGALEPESANTGNQFEPWSPWNFDEALVNKPAHASVWLSAYED